MYIPHYFKQNNQEQIIELIQKNEFAVMMVNIENKIEAVHLPFQLILKEDKIILQAHLAKQNKLALAINNQLEALVIFQGAHAYVSSSWYGHINVPTWNYEAVHCYGKLQPLDETATEALMQQTMNKYESTITNGMRYEQLPEKLKTNLLKEIVAFEITVAEVQAKSKLSQNRNEQDYQNIINNLENGNENDKNTAIAMKNIIKNES